MNTVYGTRKQKRRDRSAVGKSEEAAWRNPAVAHTMGYRGLGRNLHRAPDGRLPDPPSIRKRRVYPDAYAALVFRPK